MKELIITISLILCSFYSILGQEEELVVKNKEDGFTKIIHKKRFLLVTRKDGNVYKGLLDVRSNCVLLMDEKGFGVTIPVDSIQKIRFINGFENGMRIFAGSTFTLGGLFTAFIGAVLYGFDSEGGPSNYTPPTGPLIQDRTIELVGFGIATVGIILLCIHRHYELKNWDFIIEKK